MKNHFKNYFYSSFAIRALGVVSVPITTHFISPSEYGMVSLFNAYTGIFIVLYTCNFHTSISRYYFELKDDFKSFVGFSFFASIISTIVLGILSVLYLYIWNPQTILPKWVFVLFIFHTIFSVASSVFIQIHEPVNNSGLIARRTVFTGIFQFAIITATTIFAPNPKWIYLIFSQSIVSFFINLYFFKHISSNLKFDLKVEHFKYIYRYSIPLIPYTLSGVLLSQIDRVMISRSNNINDTGIYSFAMTLSMLMPLIGDSINRAFTPVYFKYIDEKNYIQHDIDCKKYLKYWVFFAGIFILTFSEPARLFIGDRFLPSLELIPLVIFGLMFEFVFNFYARNIGYAKKTVHLSLILLLSGTINIMLNYFTLKEYGYKIAALNTVFSYFVLFVMAWVVSKYILKLHTFALRHLYSSFLIMLIIILCFYLDRVLDVENQTHTIFKYLVLLFLSFTYFRDIIYARFAAFMNSPEILRLRVKKSV